MNNQSVSIDFTVVVDFERKDGLYIARADKFGMVAWGKTRGEAQRRVMEGLDLLNSFFQERSGGHEEAVKYLESRGVGFQIRSEYDEEPEATEILMSFGVPA